MYCSSILPVRVFCIRPAEPRRSLDTENPNGQDAGTIHFGASLSIPSCLGREWQFDAERRAPADLRSKVYRTVVKLHNSKRACESDSAASRPRGKKQLENLLTVFRWNAQSGVAHGNFRHLPAAGRQRNRTRKHV